AFEITNGDPSIFSYNSYYTEHNPKALGEYSITEFVGIYAKVFFEHPKDLLLHFLRRNTALWSVIKPEEEIAGCVNLYTDYHVESFDYSYPTRTENGATGLISTVTDKLTENRFVYTFVWRTGIYTLFLLASLVYCLIKRNIKVILVFIPVLLNIFALYAASGWTDYRYYWPNAVMTLFIIPFVNIYIKKNSKEEC
ncbi:MAG: hypothetical protein IK068_03250, partial [Lachnospiraceae bacterium]|nr:hypothetical protein [Lachnospiraceae bacterium]